MEDIVNLETLSFLNRATESPWSNCAPYTIPVLKHDKIQLYNMLDYNILKHFKRDFVVDILLRPALEETYLRSKRWRELYGRFCTNPHETITKNDIKYIHECIPEMSPFGMTKLIETLKLLIIGEQNEDIGPSTSNFTPATDPQALTYYQGGALFLQPGVDPLLSNLQNTNVYEYPNTNFQLYNPPMIPQEIRLDQSGLFRQPINYPSSSNINLNRRGNKTSLTTRQQNLMRMYQPIQPKLPLHSTFQEIQQVAADNSHFGIHQPFLENRSLEMLEPPDEIARPREPATLLNLGNFEINENGDIVFLDNKRN